MTRIAQPNNFDFNAYGLSAGNSLYKNLKRSKVSRYKHFTPKEEGKALGKYSTTQTKKENQKLSRIEIDCALLNDLVRLDYDEIRSEYLHKYPLIYRVENTKWINGLYQEVTEGEFFSLSYIKNKITRNKKKFLLDRMNLRRVIKEGVDVNALIYNSWLDLNSFVDNDDQSISLDWIAEACKKVSAKPIEEIKEEYKQNIEELKRRTFPKTGIICRRGFNTEERNRIIKMYHQDLLDKHYDPELSIVENHKAINKIHKIGLRTIETYCKEKGYTKQKQKEKDVEKILSLYDCNLSIRKNIEEMKKYGVEVSKSTLQRILKTYTDQ